MSVEKQIEKYLYRTFNNKEDRKFCQAEIISISAQKDTEKNGLAAFFSLEAVIGMARHPGNIDLYIEAVYPGAELQDTLSSCF